jgi:Protein of unknown function (DUF669)
MNDVPSDDLNEFSFDPTTQEGSHFDLIPPGSYAAEVIEAGIGTPKTGNGSMLSFTWKIITEGPHEGRPVWETYCYLHPSMQAQEIARRKLKDVCDAMGIKQQVTDPEVFKFKPVLIKVGIESDKNGQYDDKNKILSVKPLPPDGDKPNPPAAPASKRPAQTLDNSIAAPAPWRRSGQ